MSPRSARLAFAAVLPRRRPVPLLGHAVIAATALALLIAGWAAADGKDATGRTVRTAAAARTAPSPRIPRQGAPHPFAPSPAPSTAAADRAPSSGAGGTRLPAPRPTATAAAAPGNDGAEEPENTVHELPVAVDKGSAAALSVAALDLTDGRRAGYGTAGEPVFDTASIVKVDVLAALLLQAQDARHGLTATQRDLASDMIRSSDNNATDHLWNAIGGTAGLTRADRRLGLTHTTAGAGGLWGLTQTTAHDQLGLLSAVYGTGHSPLSARSRAYIRSLMAQVEKDQWWGVSAGGTATGLKNGWLPRTATGKWDVNSIGLVSVGGHHLLLATLSSGNSDMNAGVTLLEKGARAAVRALGLHGTA